MNAAAIKRQNSQMTNLPADTWTDVSETIATGEVLVVTDVLISSNQGQAVQQFRAWNGSASYAVWTLATSSDRSEQIHFRQAVHLKDGYRLQASASANSYCTVNYYVI
jgi:hypothetical protein